MSVAQLLGPPEPDVPPRRRAALTVVPVHAVAASTRGPFAAAVVALLVAGLFGLLFLNTVLGKDSFRLHELRVSAGELADTEQALIREVEGLRAPGTLAQKATEMGMVQAGPPAFLRLSDGAVLGATDPAAAPLAPGLEAGAAAQDPSAADGSAAVEGTATGTESAETENGGAEDGSAESATAETAETAETETETADTAETESADSE